MFEVDAIDMSKSAWFIFVKRGTTVLRLVRISLSDALGLRPLEGIYIFIGYEISKVPAPPGSLLELYFMNRM